MALFGMARSRYAATTWRIGTQEDLRQAQKHAAESKRTPVHREISDKGTARQACARIYSATDNNGRKARERGGGLGTFNVGAGKYVGRSADNSGALCGTVILAGVTTGEYDGAQTCSHTMPMPTQWHIMVISGPERTQVTSTIAAMRSRVLLLIMSSQLCPIA
jgi:hypothetical protein